MSLVGNLEDLGLGDILQIVSLSRKSGVLVLQSQDREGKIIFRNGQVIQATSTSFRENLGDLLLKRGLADLETIKNALQVQRTIFPPPRIGTILVDKFGIPGETVETLVREQIERIVYSFFAWHEGTFSFELSEPSEMAATSFDPLQFMLDSGLNPQWLAMEGSRILDEKRHRGEALDEGGEESLVDVDAIIGPAEPAPQPATVQEGRSRPLICADDDEVTRQLLSTALERRGYQVTPCASTPEFIAAIDESCRSGAQPYLLVDLLMPRQDGSGILGGLELLERLRIEYPGLPAAVISDHPNDEARRRIKDLGLPAILQKPNRTEVRQDEGSQRIESLALQIDRIFNATDASATGSEDAHFNLGAELRLEFGEQEENGGTARGPETPGLYLLRGMLQELQNPALGGGIILLVLRFASELMNRAVIFLVKEEEIVGLGQFGIDLSNGSADERVRRMRIPRNAGSSLDEVLNRWMPLKLKLSDNDWDSYLLQELGGGFPEEVFLGPIVSEGKIVAVLYGDNLPRKKVIGDTESLEIFLSQAGLAMEKALLERRLRSREMNS